MLKYRVKILLKKIILSQNDGIKPYEKNCPYSELFWSAFSRIQSECGEMRTKITANTDTFHAVKQIETKTKVYLAVNKW